MRYLTMDKSIFTVSWIYKSYWWKCLLDRLIWLPRGWNLKQKTENIGKEINDYIDKLHRLKRLK